MSISVPVYNQNGELLEERLAVSEGVFGVKANQPLLAQYVRVYLSNQRQGTSKSKTRSEVSGGGRKPWAQKGTGRARQGSIRSPIWVGGGRVFGPSPRDWRLKMPERMRRSALVSALSAKAEEGNVSVLRGLSLSDAKTKRMAELFSKIHPEGRILLVPKEPSESILLSVRNLERVQMLPARDLNAFAVLGSGWLLFLEDGLQTIEERLGGEK